MDETQHYACVQRALELGRSGDPVALGELEGLLQKPSPEVRRLAASAVGKLAADGADGERAVKALIPVALSDRHAQVQQYAIKSLGVYGVAAEGVLLDLEDLANSPHPKAYVCKAAAAASRIREALAYREEQKEKRCSKCNRLVDFDEYKRSIDHFQRIYCDHCYDETCVRRRNWETKVEGKKNLKTVEGTLVQSKGEKQIAEWLELHDVVYRYDDRLRIIEGFQIRPDFYLPSLDVYIEYWGMDTARYKAGMYVKQDLYMHHGKKLLSLYPKDLPELDQVLAQKLQALGWSASANGESQC
ncbi:HEAT repeat domain-containing protein [Kiritimatiellaeota bacterium B1221]|nr:HEAT repeat domain-containing protein [Kiritimatiellaeota bacterium B1221]